VRAAPTGDEAKAIARRITGELAGWSELTMSFWSQRQKLARDREVFVERLDEEQWSDIHTFRYTGFRFDVESGTAEFDFLLSGHRQQQSFTDRIDFTAPENPPAEDIRLRTLRRVLELLYIAVGTIYYKSMAPLTIAVDSVRLAPAAHRWAQQIYRQGLAEFAYRWSLPHVLRLDLSCEPFSPARHRCDMASGDGIPLVAIGGGKDSIVSLEALRAGGLCPAVFSVQRRPTPVLSEMMSRAGGKSFLIRHTVDPRMTELLRSHSVRIGHVPVTAINSLIGVATAVLHSLGPVVMSNERSAQEGNLVWQGHKVNHQWSKGLEAEELLREALKEHAGLDNACFSLLRGMSELHIAQLFAGTTRYDTLVTSCNHFFRVDHQEDGERWCRQCAKCLFVYLIFAPFMERSRLVNIFGQDLLDDERHIDGYRELLGLSGHKPFECVGEIIESRVAAGLLAHSSGWAGARVVSALHAEVDEWPTVQQRAAVLTPDPPGFAPPTFARALGAMQDSMPRTPALRPGLKRRSRGGRRQ
jgi:hypothetical protein